MKYSNPGCIDKVYALCRIALLPALFALLAACAGNQPKVANVRTDRVAVKVTPKARADFVTAMAFVKSVEYERAIRSFNKVIEQAPDNPVPYVNLALVYKLMQNLIQAEKYLKLAIRIDPENPVANNEYALLLRKTGRFSEAKRIYEKILVAYPNFIMAHKNLGILCDIYLPDNQCALKHYEIYSIAKPDDAEVKIWIADLRSR